MDVRALPRARVTRSPVCRGQATVAGLRRADGFLDAVGARTAPQISNPRAVPLSCSCSVDRRIQATASAGDAEAPVGRTDRQVDVRAWTFATPLSPRPEGRAACWRIRNTFGCRPDPEIRRTAVLLGRSKNLDRLSGNVVGVTAPRSDHRNFPVCRRSQRGLGVRATAPMRNTMPWPRNQVGWIAKAAEASSPSC